MAEHPQYSCDVRTIWKIRCRFLCQKDISIFMKYCKNNGLVKLKETRLKSLVFSVVGARANPQLDRVNGGKGGNLLRIDNH